MTKQLPPAALTLGAVGGSCLSGGHPIRIVAGDENIVTEGRNLVRCKFFAKFGV